MNSKQKSWSFTYDDIGKLTGLTLSGISQHVGRGNFDPEDLESLVAFILMHGTPEVRLRLLARALKIDRQSSERQRIQSTPGVGRTPTGQIPKNAGAKAPKKKKA